MTVQSKDLWGLALDQQWIDPGELAEAIQEQVVRGDLDFRTRLLIRDSMSGLRNCWGKEKVSVWRLSGRYKSIWSTFTTWR